MTANEEWFWSAQDAYRTALAALKRASDEYGRATEAVRAERQTPEQRRATFKLVTS